MLGPNATFAFTTTPDAGVPTMLDALQPALRRAPGRFAADCMCMERLVAPRRRRLTVAGRRYEIIQGWPR
jgi:hypothetical protein